MYGFFKDKICCNNYQQPHSWGADIGYCLAVCKLSTKDRKNRTKGTGTKGAFLV
ncbi:cu(I)/Ag(I) efflux system membrane CusB domain protein [Escherichia coli BCE002_MS12]|nr:cu(I)/Ag(I) efflux system membrane CusB domain protein [Escherichia coli BCE002_MS12]EMX85264.1 cu(I)/Ag(I) efflux system membrane CusB domain protein [Escherichia coli BCE001_MS16]